MGLQGLRLEVAELISKTGVERQDSLNSCQKEKRRAREIELAKLRATEKLGIKCPTCGSQNIEKISGAEKVGAAALFGVFAIGHVAKSFKCWTCGYKW